MDKLPEYNFWYNFLKFSDEMDPYSYPNENIQ